MQHYIEVFGQETLNLYSARSYYSAPADYGVAFESAWDADDRSLDLGVDMEGLEKLIAEKGEIVHVK